jgi:hypothetical protein
MPRSGAQIASAMVTERLQARGNGDVEAIQADVVKEKSSGAFAGGRDIAIIERGRCVPWCRTLPAVNQSKLIRAAKLLSPG